MSTALLLSFAMIIGLLAATAGCLGLAVKSLRLLSRRRGARQSWTHFTAKLCVASLWILIVMTGSIWAWAYVYILLGLFNTFEAALYFSVVSFTTVGYGDVVIEAPWRLMAGMTAAHGLLSFGLYTAFFVEALEFPIRRRSGQTKEVARFE